MPRHTRKIASHVHERPCRSLDELFDDVHQDDAKKWGSREMAEQLDCSEVKVRRLLRRRFPSHYGWWCFDEDEAQILIEEMQGK